MIYCFSVQEMKQAASSLNYSCWAGGLRIHACVSSYVEKTCKFVGQRVLNQCLAAVVVVYRKHQQQCTLSTNDTDVDDKGHTVCTTALYTVLYGRQYTRPPLDPVRP